MREPQVRVDQEHRVLHRQDARLDGRRPDADADRARPARPLRGAVPLAVGAARRLPRRARLLHVPLGLRRRASAPTTWRATARTSSASSMFYIGIKPENDDSRAAGRDRRAVRRHRDREQRLQVHAHAHDEGPGEAREGRPEPPPRGAPPAAAASGPTARVRPPLRASRGGARGDNDDDQREIPLYTLEGVKDAEVTTHYFSTEDGLGLSMLRFNRDPEATRPRTR